MRLTISVLAVVCVVSIMARTAEGHLFMHNCNKHKTPKAELRCATKNRQHAQATIRWARTELRTPSLFDPLGKLKLAAIVRNHRWLYQQMTARIAEAHARMVYMLPYTSDWITAVRIVQRAYPGSEPWLLNCSAGEGGHGRWVPQAQGGSPGGWMQYNPGTFVHDYNRAAADVRARGFKVPGAASSWYSALGQALAGGWAWGHDRPAGKWTGGGC